VFEVYVTDLAEIVTGTPRRIDVPYTSGQRVADFAWQPRALP
jgi:hypothetical protein